MDIFSAGCVFYYVLSGGKHPFGDSLRRQSNIMSDDYKLDKLSSNGMAVKIVLTKHEEIVGKGCVPIQINPKLFDFIFQNL